ncbi:hypothetical protein CHARACLAT_026333 [Characodon lateralis]|uniref:Secreted protein n=1 Tax=Characodon lateralis TaxID=208331 RepID=A0ABU7ENQ9_9TELE|nr:hypothetical protein [Characodon lateralis]
MQPIFMFYISVLFIFCLPFPLMAWDVSMSEGPWRRITVYFRDTSHLSPPPFSAAVYEPNMFTGRSQPRINEKARSEKALCWQGSAINSTVILCGRFSSNAGIFFLPGGKN